MTNSVPSTADIRAIWGITQNDPWTNAAEAMVHPQGLKIVFEGHDPIVDIVAIHGLDGHREETWTATNKIHWLRDLLPNDIPRARVFCWGYDANTYAVSGTSKLFLYDHARTLVSDLTRKRELTHSMQRPIIFIAHSLGGIVVKSALIHSDAARQGALIKQRSIKLSTYGIIFMGTPHQGRNGIQLGRVLINIASVFVPTNDRILKHLERDSDWLLQQLGQYGPISGDFVTKYGYEEYETPVAQGKTMMIVPRASAVVPGEADSEPIAIHANHVNMVKFPSAQDVGYITISEHLQIMMMSAAEVIQSRWEADSRAENARGNELQYYLTFSLSEVNVVDHFVGRQDELAKMQKILTEGSDRKTCVLHGLGGIGKTQLTVAFLKRNHANYSAVLWLNATDESTLKQGFVKAANRIRLEHPSVDYLECAISSDEVNDIVNAVKRWLNERNNTRWLVVYDNYDNPKLDSNAEFGETNAAKAETSNERPSREVLEPFDIRPYIPESYHGAVIITARPSTVKLGRLIQLGKLNCIDDGLDILQSTSNREDLREDPAAVLLAQKLDGLPLALLSAGAFLEQSSLTCREYLDLYEESWSSLQKSTPQLLSYEDRAMFSTWNISYEAVISHNMFAAMLLELWAYFDSKDIWYGLLCSYHSEAPMWIRNLTSSKLTFENGMRLLCNYGLVEAECSTNNDVTESRGYSVHGCVHAWMRHVLKETPDVLMANLAIRCVEGLAKSLRDGDILETQRRLLHHADRSLELMSGEIELVDWNPWINVTFGNFYSSQSQIDKAESMYIQALESFEKVFGPEHETTLMVVDSLGVLYSQSHDDRRNEAKAMAKRASDGLEKLMGPEHPSTLNAAFNLASSYTSPDQLDEAEAMYIRVLKMQEKTNGLNDVPTLSTVFNLGSLYFRQDRLDEAEGMYKRALEGFKAIGFDSKISLCITDGLGRIYLKQGRPDEAEAIFKQALEALEKVGTSDEEEAFCIAGNLGKLYVTQGRLDEAETMYKRALEGFEKIKGSNTEVTLYIIHSLGKIFEEKSRLDEAETMYKRALEGCEKAFGLHHTVTLDIVSDLGDNYVRQGQLNKAETTLERALHGYETTLGPVYYESHRPALWTLLSLVYVYQKLGKFEQATQCGERAQDGFLVISGGESNGSSEVVAQIKMFDSDAKIVFVPENGVGSWTCCQLFSSFY